ncbi:hypothetical protein GCM10010294_00300 [Streptomyces griseoloalbus]|nr:hypothetical protein GCM10010294_00300 [Streptomyces griseoloalbus]
MRVKKWREDAQPERPDAAGAAEESPENDEDGYLPDTRVLPLSEKPTRSTAARREADADAGPDSLEERWARLGVFSGGNDRTQVLPGAAPRTDPAERFGTPTGGDAGVPAAPDGPGPSVGRTGGPAGFEGGADGPWEVERTTALRINDRTRVLPEASPGTDPAGRPGTRTGGDAGVPAAPDRSGPSVGRTGGPAGFEGGADGPWDVERTTALRIPRQQAGVPGAQVTRPSSPAGGTRPPGDRGAAGSREDTARFTGSTPTASRTPVRDPWQEAREAAATHDPHEVTVQLDAVQIGDGGVLHRSPGRAGAGQDAPGGPVFVDESGRRSRLYRRIGMAVGLACAGYAVVMVATLLSGNSDAPWMPVPGQEKKPAGKVETTPQPAETDAVPSSGSSLLPGGTPTTGTTTTPPTPGATAPATGAAGTANQPDAADPTPTSPRVNTTQPATGDDDATPTVPDETPSSQPPDPPLPDSPDPGTTAPTGDGEAVGTDDVAGAPADPPVVAADGSAAQPEPSTAPAAPSSENVI